MGRPPLAVGTYGTIRTRKHGAGWTAHAYVRDADGRRREVARWRETKAAAERALRAALAERQHAAADGEIGAEARFGKVLERYLETIDESERAANTKYLYRSTVRNHLEPALAALRVREVTAARVDAALRAIRDASGHGTAKSARSVLSGACGLAVRMGAMTANPVREATSLGAGDKEDVRALTLDEQWRVMDWPRSSDLAVRLDLPDLIDWMLGTGMRIGEACAVRDDVLDLEAGTVEVNATVVRVTGRGLVVQLRPKTAAGWRVLALPPDLVDMLRRRRTELRLEGPREVLYMDPRTDRIWSGPSGIVFTSPSGGLRDKSNTARDLRAILDAIDRPDDERVGPFGWVHSHVFRKTVATRLDEAGLSARQIADVLGHKRPSMTQDVYMGRKVVSADAARVLARPARPATDKGTAA